MSLVHLFKHIMDGLWTMGGIGAAADLGLEYFESARVESCPSVARVGWFWAGASAPAPEAERDCSIL